MDRLATSVADLGRELDKLACPAALRGSVERWQGDCQAAMFHLLNGSDRPPLVVVLGGTGTGKSTVVNRLLDAQVSAASVRRTFTSGAIAICRTVGDIPPEWLGLPHLTVTPDAMPARGRPGTLTIVALDRPVVQDACIVDTCDLDGDQPHHHAEADRAFRWAQAAVFLVTPEKYQMTEVLSYYRMARRYGLPSLFVMNKCEEQAVLEDYRRQLAERGWSDTQVFAIPRDDAAYEPPGGSNLASLRTAVGGVRRVLQSQPPHLLRKGTANRVRDLVGRLQDQILQPLLQRRREIDGLVSVLRAMNAPAPGVDVSPLTQQLQRHLQEQSILYLMGPHRMLQRARQVPKLLMGLPRTAWDLLVRGRPPGIEPPLQPTSPAPPDFPRILADQFTILQSRIDDLLKESLGARQWLNTCSDAYRQIKIDAAEAASIAEKELAELKLWLEQRWHATPRDTAILQRLLRALPGGQTLTKWSEATPYLLAIIVAAHGALFGPIDLAILGSFSLATWLGEKLSNEVTSRTRLTNRQIGRRFADLARRQIDSVIAYLETQAPPANELRRLSQVADAVAESLGQAGEAE